MEPAKIARGDADDLSRRSVHHQEPTDRGRITAKCPNPVVKRQHADNGGAADVIGVVQRATELGANAQRREEISRHDCPRALLGGGAVAPQSHAPFADAGKVQRDEAVTQISERRIRGRLPQFEDLVGVRHSLDGAEHDRARDREHGRVGANAEREGHDHRDGEAVGAPERADGEMRVESKLVDELSDACAVSRGVSFAKTGFADAVDVAETVAGETRRFIWREAMGAKSLLAHREVQRDFLVHVTYDIAWLEQGEAKDPANALHRGGPPIPSRAPAPHR